VVSFLNSRDGATFFASLCLRWSRLSQALHSSPVDFSWKTPFFSERIHHENIIYEGHDLPCYVL
jgi:hypothetical protein